MSDIENPFEDSPFVDDSVALPTPAGGSAPSMLDDFDSLPAWKQDELRRAREFQARLEEHASYVKDDDHDDDDDVAPAKLTDIVANDDIVALLTAVVSVLDAAVSIIAPIAKGRTP